jgi:methyl-accepting chemotaxis protein
VGTLADSQRHRRRSFVSKPNFQLKLTIVFMLVVTIVANLVGGICYLFLSDKIAQLMASNPEIFAGVEMGDVARFLVPRILLAEAISLCIVFVLSILITHTIAGPVYRLEQTAKEIAKGNLGIVTRLRPRDEFKELADAFNDMCAGLAVRLLAIREAVEDCEAAGGDDFAPVYKALDRIRLPEDGTLPTLELVIPEGDESE